MSTTSAGRALRGSCHCGRNQYIVRIPREEIHDCQVLFGTGASHRIATASPLSAHLRVPLTWYHSQTFPFFPDETRSAIRRIFSHPAEQHAIRHFCGFCGTPLSYWSERPRSEAEFIHLTLGSLLTEDLHDLEVMGLLNSHGRDGAGDAIAPVSTPVAAPVPTIAGSALVAAVAAASAIVPAIVAVEPETDEMELEPVVNTQVVTTPTSLRLVDRERSTVIPWFESLIEGTRLGDMRTVRGRGRSRNGRARVEWEITEWEAGDGTEVGDADGDAGMQQPENGGNKRKRSVGEQEVMGTVRL